MGWKTKALQRLRHFRRHWNAKHSAAAAYAVAEGYRSNFAQSNSMTKTKTRTERMKGDDVHSGVNTVTYRFNLRRRSHNIIPTKLYLEENYSVLCNGTQGKQAIHNICVICPPNQFFNSLTPANPDAATYVIPAIQMNPNQTSTGSIQFASRTQPHSEKISLGNMTLQLQITNFSTASAYYDVYVCQAKEDIMSYNNGTTFANAITTWGDCTLESGYGVSGQVFAAATYGTSATTGSASYLQVGNRPTLYPGWNSLWKVLKVHKIALGSNAEQFLNLVFTINHNFDLRKAIAQNPNMDDSSASWSYANQRVSIYKGGIHVFAVSRGQGVVAADSSVTTSSQEIGCVVTRRAKYNLLRAVNEPQATVQAKSNITTTSASIKQINIVDVASAVANV